MTMTVFQRALKKREEATVAAIEMGVLNLCDVPRMLAVGSRLRFLH